MKVIKAIDLSTGVPEGMAFTKDTNMFYRQYNLDYKVQGNGDHIIEADRMKVCTESSKHIRMFICFVALILASYIRHIRDSKPELVKAFPSISAILEEMHTIRCIEHDGHHKFITPFVGDQLLICDAFGFEVPEGCRPTYTSKKSNIGKRGRQPKPQTETS